MSPRELSVFDMITAGQSRKLRPDFRRDAHNIKHVFRSSPMNQWSTLTW